MKRVEGRRWPWLYGGVLALMALLGLGMGQAAERKTGIGLGVGYYPPPFESTDLSGNRQSISAYKGRVLVLHFWASWCPYCRSEIPELTELHQQWAAKGVRVLAVSSDEDVSALKRFVAKNQLPYPIIAEQEADESISDQYGISGIPVTYIIGKDGRIAKRLNGASEIIQAVQQVL